MNITLGQIGEILAGVVGIIGGVEYILKRLNKMLDSKMQPLHEEIRQVKEDLHKEISDTKVDSLKNFLCKTLNDVERGVILDEATEERLYESYTEYTEELHQNGYIKKRWHKIMEKE